MLHSHTSHHQASSSLVGQLPSLSLPAFAHDRPTPEEVKAQDALTTYRREQQRRFLLSKQTTIDRVRNLLK